jgi:hypothetical protein
LRRDIPLILREHGQAAGVGGEVVARVGELGVAVLVDRGLGFLAVAELDIPAAASPCCLPIGVLYLPPVLALRSRTLAVSVKRSSRLPALSYW